jgi:hypothetical protein
MSIRIWWDTSVQAYRMVSPYNQDLVTALKSFIPVSDRSYDPATKIWTFVERQYTPLLSLLAKLNCTPQVMSKQQVEQAAQQTSQQAGTAAVRVKPLDSVLIEFVRLLPYDAARTAYRKAAMELHPDKGGDPAKAASLNDAWTRVAKELYGQ